MASSSTSSRMFFMDNLRVFIILLVILLHGSMVYMAYAPEWWYVLDPQKSLFFTMLVLLIDVAIMPIMFFLSGYFALPSLRKRGTGPFLKDKLVRVGIPWVFGVLFLAPFVTYLIYFTRKVPMGYLQFWMTDFWGKMYQQSVYWYLGILTLLYLLLSLVFTLSSRFRSMELSVSSPGPRFFVGFIAITTVVILVINQFYPLDAWTHNYLFVFQPARVPHYIGYFILGIYAYQNRWFTEGGYLPRLAPWGITGLLTGLAYLSLRFSAGAAQLPFLLKAAMDLLFTIFCMSCLMSGVAFFKSRVDSDRSFWKVQAAASYGTYYIHPLILFPLAYLFVQIALPLALKAPVVILLAAALSWSVSAFVLNRAPVLREMFS